MKLTLRLSKWLMAILLFTAFQSKAQNTYQISGLQDTTGFTNSCDSSVFLSIAPNSFDYNSNANYFFRILGSNYSGGTIVATVDWGDGNTTTHTGQSGASGQAISFQPSLWHMYANNNSWYPIGVTVTNPDNQTSATDSVYHNVSSCQAYFYGVVNLDCDGDGNVDSTITNNVPFNLTGNNGATNGGVLYNSQATVYNVVNGTYALSLNQNWLNQNGYVLTSMQPSTIQMVQGGQYTFQATIECDSVTPPPNNGCVFGSVFCDDNGNGVQDSMEFGIGGAPVSIQYNGTTYNTVTDNGYYDASFPMSASGGQAYITVNAQWLAQNGYYLPNNTDSTMQLNCGPGTPMVNFAVNCDSAQIQNECVYGVVFCDSDSNGVQNNGEMAIPYAPIELTGSSGTITTYSNGNGYFGYYGTNLGSATAALDINAQWMTQHGYSFNGPITVSTSCSQQNFIQVGADCGPAAQPCADMWTSVSPWIGYYQNQTNYIKLKWGNYGPAPAQSYTLTLTFPAGVTPNTSSIAYSNYTISGNTITWTFNNSNSSYFSYSDVISFFVPMGFPSGTQHYYTSTITVNGNNADCHSGNNNGSLMMILGNSYDPNDKNVNLPTTIDPFVQDTLTYVIRFQNTGDAPAQDVYIMDTLSANLDWSTLKMIETSHDMQLVNLGNGVIKFDFPGIWLPDSTNNEPESHGHLTYQIVENAGNGVGTSIENTAHIYFDWNAPVVTNTTYNENQVLNVEELDFTALQVYPNPTRSDVTIDSPSEIEYVKVSNLAGQVVLEQVGNNITSIDMEDLTAGVYLIQMKNRNGLSTTRKVLKK